ncbi:MAG: hypothetical protein Q7T44_11900 [Parvibaculum sp.]|nr:hypothetical protein [Parvibaculum sp.]
MSIRSNIAAAGLSLAVILGGVATASAATPMANEATKSASDMTTAKKHHNKTVTHKKETTKKLGSEMAPK